jgi:hypothetical protein
MSLDSFLGTNPRCGRWQFLGLLLHCRRIIAFRCFSDGASATMQPEAESRPNGCCERYNELEGLKCREHFGGKHPKWQRRQMPQLIANAHHIFIVSHFAKSQSAASACLRMRMQVQLLRCHCMQRAMCNCLVAIACATRCKISRQTTVQRRAFIYRTVLFKCYGLVSSVSRRFYRHEILGIPV